MLALLLTPACDGNYPIDEDGLLITERSDCYMSMFELLGPDNRTVLVSGQTVIDTTACTVTALAKFGTNLSHVKPYCSLVTDAKITPDMGTWTDFTKARNYTVISGNRQVKKVYTITISLQGQ
ncbi:MAG: DUF5018 domain-containing protein [Dysgonamonadaceae bacterium]|nr:DUF5018 domain-containing protein [Dysgonamonadaceae bacterium]